MDISKFNLNTHLISLCYLFQWHKTLFLFAIFFSGNNLQSVASPEIRLYIFVSRLLPYHSRTLLIYMCERYDQNKEKIPKIRFFYTNIFAENKKI